MNLKLRGITLLTLVAISQAAFAQTAKTETVIDLAAVASSARTASLAATGAQEVAVTADHLANYYVWVNATPTVSGIRYFNAGIGTAALGTFGTNASGWTRIAITQVEAGATAQIKLALRDTTVNINKLIVTALPNFVPTGAGAAPTPANSIPANAFATTLPVRPTGAHPRLYLGNAADRATIVESRRLAYLAENRGKLEHDMMRAAWDRLAKAATSTLAAPASAADCKAYGQAIQAKALYYQLEGNAQHGQTAVTMMRTYIDSCGYDYSGTKRVMPGTRTAGDSILLSALVYDWARPFVTAADEELYLRRFLERAAMEIGFPPDKQGHIVGHGSEMQLMRDQMSVAIAFYEKEPRIYDIVAGRFFRDFVPARKDFLYKSGFLHQGPSYGMARFACDMYAAWIFRRMAGIDVFGLEGKEMLYQPIYMRRPDGQLMRDGDTFDSSYTKLNSYWFQPEPFMLAASYFKDPALKREFILQSSSAGDDLARVLFSDSAIKPLNGAPDLPLTKFYGGTAGYMVARTGWTDLPVDLKSNVVVATMKVGHTNFSNHQHLDAGHFQLYYKGGLAIDTGIYEGMNGTVFSGYASAHDWNYHKRTVAHNAMLVFQPGEKFANADSNDGGQRFVTLEPYSQAMVQDPANKYTYGGNIRSKFGPDLKKPAFSYIKGDLHRAYTEKVSNYQRSFVFLNTGRTDVPAALVVFDRIRSAQASYHKRWLLHSVGEPKINTTERTVTVDRTDNGYNGRLVNRTLLPAQVTYTKYGKPGEEYVVPNTAGTALVNYPVAPKSPTWNSEESGPWRIEVAPTVLQASDTLLNVMQVMDASPAPAPLATELLRSIHFVGARVDNTVVLFGVAETNVGTGATFTLPASTVKRAVLVTDLQAGTWTVKKGSTTLAGSYTVADTDGTIYLPALDAGTYTLQRTN